MIKNIVFDIGQVLVTYDWKTYLKGFGFSEEINERIAKAVFLNDVWNVSDLGTLGREELADRFAANDPELSEEIRRVFAGAGACIIERKYAPRLVAEMKRKGCRVYFLSNYARWCYEDSKEILDKFLSLMEGGVFSFDVHKIKPDAGIYKELLSRYGLEAQECLFIDDREENLQGAEAVGMKGLLFTGYEEVWEKLECL